MILIALVIFHFSCGGSAADSSIDQNLVTAPTPLPNIYIDERGNSIKQDGWLPPDINLGRSVNTLIGKAKTTNGETIQIELADMDGPRGRFIQTPFESARLNELYDPAKIVRLMASAVPNNGPYCYLVSLVRHESGAPNNTGRHADLISVDYCDVDGDAIFETIPKTYADWTVPEWAMRNPSK